MNRLNLTILITFVSTCIAFASKIDTLKIVSQSMNKSITNLVILPDTYENQKQPFNTLYLLHGAGGDYSDWSTKVPLIQKYADQFNLIVVCPDGGKFSWYFDSPIDSTMRYETYISNELIKGVDQTYNTNTTNKNRAITGLSMGGHGAFYLAFKHQDIWGAAGSMSGGLDLRPFASNWKLSQRLGDYANQQENWEKNTVINMVYLLKKDSIKLIFDCGIDDFFYEVNNNLHAKLLERNIPHDYIQRPGKHNWDYWANAIKYQLQFFDDFFKSK